jgi:hypothetical protein
MPTSSTTLHATKAAGYFDSLCRHFARKVAVERDGDQALMHFPMGQCVMTLGSGRMHFECRAADSVALEAVQSIIASHALRFIELRDSDVAWAAR